MRLILIIGAIQFYLIILDPLTMHRYLRLRLKSPLNILANDMCTVTKAELLQHFGNKHH